MNMALVLILLGNFQVTSYRSVPEQTDDSPFHTSTGERVSPDGIAVSQDLLCSLCLKLHMRCRESHDDEVLHYGDWVYVENIGLKRINDVMNRRHKRRMDIWVATFAEEKAFHKQYKSIKLTVWKAKGAKNVPVASWKSRIIGYLGRRYKTYFN